MGGTRGSPDAAQERSERQFPVSRSCFDQGCAHRTVVRTDQAAEAGLDPAPWLGRIPGDICNATVSRRAGQWHVAVQWQREVSEPAPSDLPAVGIDRGITVFAALTDGTAIAPVNHGKKALRALRKAQRNLSRKKRGSSNRRKAVRRVAKIQMRVVNARKNFLHEQTTTIANNHGTVVVEALKVRNMSASAKGTVAEPGKNVRQKTGLNRAILDQGWGGFRIMLAYKLADRGLAHDLASVRATRVAWRIFEDGSSVPIMAGIFALEFSRGQIPRGGRWPDLRYAGGNLPADIEATKANFLAGEQVVWRARHGQSPEGRA